MWAEFIIPGEDLERLLREAIPLTINFGGSDAVHSLALSDLAETRLVADRGLRVVCKARVTWPILGVRVPIAMNSVTIFLLPTIGRGPHGDMLTFRVSIENADLTGVPAAIDTHITAAINAKLAEKGVELSWDFSQALTYLAPLPALLDPLESFAVRPAWGKVRITEEAVVYAVSFHTAFVRRGERAPDPIVAAEPGPASQGSTSGC